MPRPDFDIPRFTGDPMALASFFTVFEVFSAAAQLSDTRMIAEIFRYLDRTTADRWIQVPAVVTGSYEDFRHDVLFLHPPTAWLNGRQCFPHLSAVSLLLEYTTTDHLAELWQETLQVTSELCNYGLMSEVERRKTLSHLSARFISGPTHLPTPSIVYEYPPAPAISVPPSSTHFNNIGPPRFSHPTIPAAPTPATLHTDREAFVDLCDMYEAGPFASTPPHSPFISSDPFLDHTTQGDIPHASPIALPATIKISVHPDMYCTLATTSEAAKGVEDPFRQCPSGMGLH